MIVYPIKCDTCGFQTGQWELPRSRWEGIKLSNKVLGIESVCDDCAKKAKKKQS